MIKHNIKKLFLVLFIFSFIGCSTFKSWISPISKYDQKSYENFISLKVTTKQLINDLSPTLEKEKIDNYFFNLDLIYEYEIGKGIGNIEIINQITLLKERIETLILESKEKELSTVYKDLKKETLLRIINVIITTEHQKLR